jgi:hypothetical protein
MNAVNIRFDLGDVLCQFIVVLGLEELEISSQQKLIVMNTTVRFRTTNVTLLAA